MNDTMDLNLPKYDFRIKTDDRGCRLIFDPLRSKFVALTPEEWVRQNFVAFLINEKNFPKGLIGNEISLTQNGIKRRCDTLVSDKNGEPLVIVEYKAPGVAISQHTFDQIVRYNSVFLARYLIVSNGLAHYCCQIDYENKSYRFLQDIPQYEQLNAI